jgi:hypothetical protein
MYTFAEFLLTVAEVGMFVCLLLVCVGFMGWLANFGRR